MKPHKRQYLSDYLASGLAILQHVKEVRGCGVIHESNW